MPTDLTTPTVAELAAHQQARHTYAFSLGDEGRRLARLQAVHAKKTAELNTYSDLLEETTPDLILRAADGRQLTLRLHTDDVRSLCCIIREALENEIRSVEERIIEHLLAEQGEREIAGRNSDTPAADLRPAILALCTPTAQKPAEGLGAGPTVGVEVILEALRRPYTGSAAA